MRGATLPGNRTYFGHPLVLDRSSSKPLNRQLYDHLAQAIRNGELEAGTLLPSTRRTAKLLGISRNTVLAAYDALAADDLINGKRGSGMRVRADANVTGMRAVGLRRVLRQANYPARTISLTDPDGNPIYLNF